MYFKKKKERQTSPYTLSITRVLNKETVQVVLVMKAKYNNPFNNKFKMLKTSVARGGKMHGKPLRQQ